MIDFWLKPECFKFQSKFVFIKCKFKSIVFIVIYSKGKKKITTQKFTIVSLKWYLMQECLHEKECNEKSYSSLSNEFTCNLQSKFSTPWLAV